MRREGGHPGRSGHPDRGNGVRIGVLIDLVPRKAGSLEDWLVHLARASARHGHQLTVFGREPIEPGVRLALREAGAGWRTLDSLEDRPLEAVRRLRRFDVLHLNLLSPRSRASILAFAAWPARVLFVDHVSVLKEGAASSLLKRLASRAVRIRLAGLAGVSEHVTGRARARFGLTGRRARTIYNGVDVRRFHPPDTGRREGKEFTVLSAAHLIPEKGTEVLLRAISACSERVRLMVAGDGPERQRLERLAVSLGLEDRVEFLGLRNDVDRLLREVDTFAHPALWQEAFGLTVAEAMASGLPVIASDVGGIPELIEDGRTGLLVAPGDVAALTAALGRLMERPQLGAELGRAARQRVERRFSLERCAALHLAWCEEAALGESRWEAAADVQG